MQRIKHFTIELICSVNHTVSSGRTQVLLFVFFLNQLADVSYCSFKMHEKIIFKKKKLNFNTVFRTPNITVQVSKY